MVLKHPTDYQQGKTMVYFVRHGNIHSKQNNISEHPESGLSDLGKQQAKLLAKEFSKKKDEVDVLYSSTMIRALETAKELGKTLHKKPIPEHGLCEVNKILWTKKYYLSGYWRTMKKYLAAKRTLNKILREHQGKVIVLVCHGGVIRALLGWKFGLSFKQRGSMEHHNCHITLLRFQGTKLEYIHYFNSKGLA